MAPRLSTFDDSGFAYSPQQGCKFVYEDMSSLMGMVDEEDDDDELEFYDLNTIEQIIDVVSVNQPTNFYPIIQEMTSLIHSLSQKLDRVQSSTHKKLDLFLTQQHTRFINSVNVEGPYIPVPFTDGQEPKIKIKHADDILKLSQAEINYLLNGYGIFEHNGHVDIQRKKLAYAIGVNPRHPLLLGV